VAAVAHQHRLPEKPQPGGGKPVKTRISVLALATLLIMGLLAPSALARPDRSANALTNIQIPSTQLTDPETGEVYDFQGTLDITGVSRDGRQLLLDGVLRGTLTGQGNQQEVNREFTGAPVNADAACPILFLELGPLFLDVLGLVVEIPDPIVLDIRAEPGPGRLLGNLLCAIVHLLDGPPAVDNALDNLIGRLNQLLDRILG
jgi:hypothetical protein